MSPPHQLSATLLSVSLSCPSLHLDVRDGRQPQDRLLHQAFASSNSSVRLASSANLLRLELHADSPFTNLTHCFVVFRLLARLAGNISCLVW